MKKLTSLLLCVVLVVSLCCVTASAAEDAYLEATCAVDAESGNVELVLKALQPMTNATVHVYFDSNYLYCWGLNPKGTVSNGKMEEGHAVMRIAVATADTIQPGEVAATVDLGMTGGWDETSVTVTVENWNAESGVNQSQNVTVEGTGYRFVDVSAEQWFFEAVDHMAAQGYIKGISGTHFGPALDMNRGSFVTLLGRLAGVAETQAQTRFTDVPVDSFYSGYVAWADENGIVKGVSDTLFAPAEPVTREQMVTFLYRFAESTGRMDMTVENPESVLAGFADADQVSSWALDAFIWAVDRGIINGMGQGLEPQTVTNRAQVAVMLYRFFF